MTILYCIHHNPGPINVNGIEFRRSLLHAPSACTRDEPMTALFPSLWECFISMSPVLCSCTVQAKPGSVVSLVAADSVTASLSGRCALFVRQFRSAKGDCNLITFFTDLFGILFFDIAMCCIITKSLCQAISMSRMPLNSVSDAEVTE